MANVIEFLERMGTDAQLRYANRDEVTTALADAGVGLSAQAAILDVGNRHRLESLLGADANVCCGLLPVESECGSYNERVVFL